MKTKKKTAKKLKKKLDKRIGDSIWERFLKSEFMIVRQDGNENEADGRAEEDAWKIERLQKMHEGICQAEEEM